MSEAVESSARRGATRSFIPTVEQAAVIDAPADEDVLVIAGAGSGKTTTMTHRIAALTERDHVPPERILGLTFTRKAAAELSTKIDDIMLSRSSKNSHVSASSADSLDSSALAGLVMKPHISTYDAFFQSIVSQYGLLVGMDPRTQPLSDAGSIQIISDIIRRNIDVLFSADLSNGDSQTGGDSSVESLENAGAVDPLIAEVRGLSQNIASSMIDESCPTMEQAIESIRSWDQKFLETLRRLRPVGVPVNDVCARPKVPTRTPSQAGKMDVAQWLEKEWDKKIVPYQANVVDYLVAKTRRRELLLTIVAWYQEEKRRLGVAEFSDFTITALQLVMRFPSIGDYYRRRYSHVFLDEYQDTSTTQATLLAALFHPADGRGHSAVTAVGDPYQSIYSWRGACPGAFRLFLQKFDVRNEPFKLLTSQRNPKIILDAANRLTEDFRTPDSLGSVPVGMREVPVDTLKPVEASTARKGLLPPSLSVMGFQNREEEADAVASFAREALSRWQESGGADSAGSRSPVAILCRSRAWMDGLAKALRAKNLTYAMVGNNPLMDRPDMSDMLALLRAAADHASSATLLRLLASPRMGMTVDDLKILSSAAGAANTDYQFLALSEAGVVDASSASSARERANVVRNLRDDVSLPTGVFLADFILSEDCDGALSSTTMSQQGRSCVRRVAGMLRRVEDAARSSIADAIRMATEVLDLDIDSAVASAVGDSGCRAVAASYADAVDVVLGQVESFGRELPSGRHATLSGFLAWLDAMTRDPDGPATDIEANVDVTLLTIHQAKGLQWPAVAVVGLADGLFPSSTGENLKVTAYGDEQRSPDDVPRYRATSKCWLEIPSEVPAPVRADRDILPRFPHRGSLEGIDDVQTLEREFSDSLNEENSRAVYTGETFLSQCEEYGRLRHEDERRLAYVALTRTQGASLLTFSKDKESGYEEDATVDIDSVDVDIANRYSRAASNFWREVHSFFAQRAEEDGLSLEKYVKRIVAGESLDMPKNYRCPVGFALCGDRTVADGLLESVARSNVDLVRRSWLQASSDEDALPWPRGLDRRMRDVLSMSARMVMGRSGDDPSPDASGADHDGRAGSRGRLTSRAVALVRGVTAEGRVRGGNEASVLERADRVRERANLGTTTIEKTLAVKGDAKKAEMMALSIIRPVPLPPAPAANRGTLFHEWAAKFLDAWIDGEVDDRSTLVAAIDVDQSLDSTERAWRHRLAQSPWSRRRPIAAELPIVAVVDDGPINGTIDAVFAGGIDDEPTEAEDSVPSTEGARSADDVLTIVDWKTGRKPTAAEDVENRLIQLDIYRLLLSGQWGVPLENIHATLYYLSEKDPQSRAIPARNRTREEIVSLIREGRHLAQTGAIQPPSHDVR